MRRINYPVPITIDLVAEAQTWVDDAIIDRTRFTTGMLTSPYGYGIIDSRDPATSVSGSTRPFTVTPASLDATVNLQGGSVVFGNGELVTLPNIASIGVPTTYAGERHVFYLQFVEEGHDPVLGDDDVLTYSWIGPPDDVTKYLRIARKVDYDLIPVTTRREQTIALAILTPTTTQVGVDMTRAQSSEVRPWASPVDIWHRSQVGTGAVTTTNPHGMTVSDLSVSAGSTLYDFMLPHGIVIAKDTGVAGVPGTLCSETIPALGIIADVTGSVTGYAGAYYFQTSKFPNQILKCVDAATKAIVLAAVQIPHKNILFFLPFDEWTTGMDVYIEYASVDACSPPATLGGLTFPAVNPGVNEVVVAGGVQVPSVLSGVGFGNMGPYPFNATVYLGSDGYLQTIPETLKCDIALSAVVGSQNLEAQPRLPTRLRVGLRNAVANPALDVKIDITGTRDGDGLQVTETVAFGASWSGAITPATAENPNQWVYTDTVFSDVLSWSVPTRVSDGPASAITIQAVYDPNSLDLANSLPVSRVFWDGTKIADVLDLRPLRVAATANPESALDAAATAFSDSALVRSPATTKAIVGVWAENFEYPQWVSSDSVVSRWSDGLGLGDSYESRAIAVRPHVSDAVSFRLVPVNPDHGFNGSIRFFTNTGWTSWMALNTLTSPKYTYTFPAATRLYKWQMRIQGPCESVMATYLAVTDDIPATMVFDSGAFGIDSLG